MQLYFAVPDTATTREGVLVRSFLRQCAVSTDLARAVKFRGGGFFADGVPVLANRRIFPGQVLSFALPPEGDGVTPQPEIPVNVVYEDAFAVVLEKPPQLAVHPTLNYPGGTLANGYAAWAAAHGHSPVFRPVNRIDKDTSGLVLAAKNAYAAPLLAGGVTKLYYAIAQGALPLGEGAIDAPIGRRGDSIIGRCVTPEGKPSRTEYTIIKEENGLSLAACVPVTGRTIRSGCILLPSAIRLPGTTFTAAAGSTLAGRRCTARSRALQCLYTPRCRTASGWKCPCSCAPSRWKARCRRIWKRFFRENCVKKVAKFYVSACFKPCKVYNKKRAYCVQALLAF